jgi:hypothetical protein
MCQNGLRTTSLCKCVGVEIQRTRSRQNIPGLTATDSEQRLTTGQIGYRDVQP